MLTLPAAIFALYVVSALGAAFIEIFPPALFYLTAADVVLGAVGALALISTLWLYVGIFTIGAYFFITLVRIALIEQFENDEQKAQSDSAKCVGRCVAVVLFSAVLWGNSRLAFEVARELLHPQTIGVDVFIIIELVLLIFPALLLTVWWNLRKFLATAR